MIGTPSILLYLNPRHNKNLELKSMVETVVLKENITIVKNTDQLIRVLRQPLNGIIAAIIHAGSAEELMSLTLFKDLLIRIPLILVLPDQEKETITKGHALRPRYITYSDSNLTDVRDVFKKIVGRANATWH